MYTKMYASEKPTANEATKKSVKVEDMSELFAGLLRDTGEIIPVVAVHSKQGDMASLPYDGSLASQMVIVETLRVLRIAGLFGQAVLMSEAWMSTLPKGEKYIPGVTTRASQDPNKQECIIAHIIRDDGTSEGAIWPIIRDGIAGSRPSLGPIKKLDAKSTKCWLDDALISEEKANDERK